MKINCSLKGCRKKFEPVKEWQKFCSKACKQKQYRINKLEQDDPFMALVNEQYEDLKQAEKLKGVEK